MTDVASLGIAVDSRQVKEGSENLKVLESMAKRTGVSVEEMRRRVQNAEANVARMRAQAQGAGNSLNQMSAAQERVVAGLNRKIAALTMGSRQLAVHTALTRAGTTADTVAGQAITRLALQHHALAQAQQASAAAGRFFDRAMRPVIGAFLGGQAVSAVQRMVGDVARIGEVARRVGQTTTEVQGFRNEVRLATGDIAQADSALVSFAAQAGRAAEGTGYLAKLFAANNVELRDQNGNLRSNSELWNEFVRLVSRASTEQERLRMATGVLGPAGKEVVDILKRGPEALSEAYRQAERDGKFLSQQAINDAQKINREWQDLTTTISVGFKSAIIGAISEVRNLGTAMDEAKARGFSMGGQWSRASSQVTVRPRAGLGLDDMVEHEAGSFLGMPSRLPPPRATRANEIERAINATRRHIAVMQAEAQAVNRTAGEQERLTTQMRLTEIAQQMGGDAAQKYADRIRAVAAAAGEAAQALARAELHGDLAFERDQLGRSSIDQSVASRLRSAGLPVDLQSVEANLIRVNEQLAIGKDLAMDFASGFRRDIKAGVSETQALLNALDRLYDRLIDMSIDTAISGLFKSFTGGAARGGLFGGALIPGLLHKGGMVGSAPSSGRFVHPTYVDDLPRFHNGGMIGAGERLIIAKTDEEMLTRDDPRHRWNGGDRASQPQQIILQPVIKNYTDSQVTTSTTDDGEMEITIRAISRDEISSRRGGNVLQQGYGVSPRLKARG